MYLPWEEEVAWEMKWRDTLLKRLMQITLNNTSITAPSAKTSDDILNQS